MDELDRCVNDVAIEFATPTMKKYLKRRTKHWTGLFGDEHCSDKDRQTRSAFMNSNFLTYTAEHGLTLYISSKLQAISHNTGFLAEVFHLLSHAMGARTAKECQLNPDLIEMLLNHSDNPLIRRMMDLEWIIVWSALLGHGAAMDPPDLRWDRWKKIAAMFVEHLPSLEQISEVENWLGPAPSISRRSASFVKQQLKEKAEQLATTESPLQSRGRRPPEQTVPASKRQKKN